MSERNKYGERKRNILKTAASWYSLCMFNSWSSKRNGIGTMNFLGKMSDVRDSNEYNRWFTLSIGSSSEFWMSGVRMSIVVLADSHEWVKIERQQSIGIHRHRFMFASKMFTILTWRNQKSLIIYIVIVPTTSLRYKPSLCTTSPL